MTRSWSVYPVRRLSWWRRMLLRAARIGTRRDLATLNRVEREFLNPLLR